VRRWNKFCMTAAKFYGADAVNTKSGTALTIRVGNSLVSAEAVIAHFQAAGRRSTQRRWPESRQESVQFNHHYDSSNS